MDGRNVHFVAAGENVLEASAETLDHFGVDRLVIIMDRGLREAQDIISKGIAKDVKEARASAEKRGVEGEVVLVDDASMRSVRGAVMEAFCKCPGDRFYFNVSSGSVEMSYGLFMASQFIGGTAYHVRPGRPVQRLEVPRAKLSDLLASRNHMAMLKEIHAHDGAMLHSDLWEFMTEAYVSKRANYSGLSKARLDRSQLGKWLTDLEELDMLRVEKAAALKKNKRIVLTGDGTRLAQSLWPIVEEEERASADSLPAGPVGDV